MKKTLWFDMDGTVADLYGRKGWLNDLRTEQDIFQDLEPLVNMEDLKDICKTYMANGYTIGIITWNPMHASPSYQNICTNSKRAWVEQHMPYVTEFYALPYGTPKQNAGFDKGDINLLVDDNEEVIKIWEEETNHMGILVAKGNTVDNLRKDANMFLDNK